MAVQPDRIEDLINSIYTKADISEFTHILMRKFHTITIYMIEPYFPSKDSSESEKIKVTDNYSIHDYGGHLVISPDEIYETPLFACSEFLLAIEKALAIICTLSAQEVAILGDYRAKLFLWDNIEKLNQMENNPLKIINFSPPEAFGMTRESILNYMKTHGMIPKLPNLTMPTPSA